MSQRECDRCGRKTDLFVCSHCTTEARRQLHDLRWWINRLIESVVGQVKLGDGGRRGTRANELHGDDTLAAHIEPFPKDSDEPARPSDRRARARAALHHALATGHVNGRASDELDRVRNTLGTWIRDICETRGVEMPQLNTAVAMATWLRNHHTVIGHMEAAKEFCEDIDVAIHRIERIVNRPTPPHPIGPCITDPAPDEILTKRREDGDRATRCGFALSAAHKATTVKCPQCGETADVEDVVAHNLAEQDETLVTVRNLVDVVLPRLDEHVPRRTVEGWITRGWLTVHGHDDQGRQMVRIGEARKVRRERPRHARAK